MNSKLNLNFDLVNESREISKRIAEDTQKFIEKHSTVTVERTICRLLGIDGVNDMGVPLPNIVVENIQASNALGLGAAMYILGFFFIILLHCFINEVVQAFFWNWNQ